MRLRRDFGAVLNLIRAHAILQQAKRERDDLGRVVATAEDYAEVRRLVVDLVSEGVGATVPRIVRHTVEAVDRLINEGDAEVVSRRDLEDELELGETAVKRRVRLALDASYLRNLEDGWGKPFRLVLGDDMPDDLEILPTVEDLRKHLFGTEREKTNSFVNGGRSAVA